MFDRSSLFQPECKFEEGTRGFLPKENPRSGLPETSGFNLCLNQVAIMMPTLVKEKKFRQCIDELNVRFSGAIVTLEKADQRDKQAAIAMLTMMAQAYVWEDLKAPARSLPAVIAKSLYELCKNEQRYPTLTYADYILYNWRLLNPQDGFIPENICPLFTITGTTDEAWFIKIHVAIEAAAGVALDAVSKAYQLANTMLVKQTYICDANKEKELGHLLGQVRQSMRVATALLKRMAEACRPAYFWETLRLHLNGWEKIKSPDGKETGIRFEGVATTDQTPSHSYRGASGAESSIIPALDAALGVKHELNGMFQTLLSFKTYMPVEHQIKISLLSRSQISEVVRQSKSKTLFTAWEDAIHGVKCFRLGHMGLVAKYLHQEAEKNGIKREDIVGTGGTPIDTYLGERHQTTAKTPSNLRSKL
jgi:indoleamine 2,3-dioxygenase